jgi:hypothetical protein
MTTHGPTALAIVLALALPTAQANFDAEDDSETLVLAAPDGDFTESGEIPDLETLSRWLSPRVRQIGGLEWHTDYDAAYRQAREEKKMLFIFFRNEGNPRIAGFYERDVLTNTELREPLSKVVRVVLPLDAVRPFRPPELPDLKMLDHSSFKYMYHRQGIAMIDLTDPDTELYGMVVSAHPFTPGMHYTVRGTKIVLNLPRGTVTQRALIYAVRLHPAAPVSTTDGQCDSYLCKQARNSSNLMMAYGSVGHHDWGTRYNEIAATKGKSAMEVAAMAGNTGLIEAAVQVVDQWYGSPAHWQIMSAPASIFGYDLVHDSAGNWWGTGLFAN